MEEEQIRTSERRRRRRRRWRRSLAGVLLFLLLALAALWFFRVSLATRFIESELARRGVQATYEVKRIGLGSQVFENLVIGDPDRPDATARRVEVEIRIGLTGPRVGLITARGVRMYGRIRDGRLSLGQIDRLLPPPSGLPFRLPDQRVDIADAAILLDTPAGRLALGLEGRGNLSDGFAGRLALVSHRLQLGQCVIAAPRADVSVAVSDLRPLVEGPVAMQAIDCGDGVTIRRPRFAVDAALAPGFDSWRGETALRADLLSAGPRRIAAISGRIGFAGDAALTSGRLDLASGGVRMPLFRAERAAIAGRYRFGFESGDFALAGNAEVAGFALAPGSADRAAATLRAAAGTPIGPIGEALATALLRAARGGARASARLRLVNGPSYGAVRVEDLRVAARSGARLVATGGEGLTYYWPAGALRLDGDFALSGGGFPSARLALRQAGLGSAMSGVARIAPIRVGESRLALDEIGFAAGRDGSTRFRTSIVMDGPVGDGHVTGLSMPLVGRFGPSGLRIGPDCTPASFRALEVQGLRLGPTRVALCPVGPALVWQAPGGGLRAGARIAGPLFAGRLGESPIRIASDSIRVDLDGFSASGLSAQLGAGADPSRLAVARLDARFVPRGVAGTFAGLSGKIANVPLLLSEGSGRWQVVRGDLNVAAAVRIADQQDPSRFHPLVSDAFRLSLADNRIEAGGPLVHPASGRRVALARIDHDLRSGAGQAVIEVPGLVFGPDFQPDALTRLTTGIVALVEGTVRGEGLIEWDSRGSRSSGTFSTADMDLAAPFGPVEGLTTSIRFTDLLGLVSAPGQLAEIDLIRPGIDIFDGRVSYQLQPDYHVAIESGRWPYAGGELILQPTILDFSRPTTKYLTFRLVGLDAARFVTAMDFGNIAATGTFDGIVPMEFDQSGGRIVGGRLVARPEGGTLSYVGELTDRDLGIYGKMAFDALKELRYNRFEMSLDGSLDGEFVTIIDLDGIARNPGGPIAAPGGAIGQMIVGRALSQLARIPFEFNIRIQGPFRALLATARSFDDPSILIQPLLPRALRDLPTSVTDVQDEESENER